MAKFSSARSRLPRWPSCLYKRDQIFQLITTEADISSSRPSRLAGSYKQALSLSDLFCISEDQCIKRTVIWMIRSCPAGQDNEISEFGVYRDISKAYHTLPHDLLMAKSEAYDFDATV